MDHDLTDLNSLIYARIKNSPTHMHCWMVHINSKQAACFNEKQARKPRSYASPKLRPTQRLTGVKCRATSVAKKSPKSLKFFTFDA